MSYIDELNAPKSVTSSGYGSVQDLCDKFAIACAEVDRLRAENRELAASLDRSILCINSAFGKAQRSHIIAEGRALLAARASQTK